MRYITVPYPVQLHNLTTGESMNRDVSFFEFVQGTLLVEKRFGKSVKELQAAARIAAATRAVKPGEVAELETTDWELLRDVAETPDGGYMPGVAVQCLPFIEAIIMAPSSR